MFHLICERQRYFSGQKLTVIEGRKRLLCTEKSDKFVISAYTLPVNIGLRSSLDALVLHESIHFASGSQLMILDLVALPFQ